MPELVRRKSHSIKCAHFFLTHSSHTQSSARIFFSLTQVALNQVRAFFPHSLKSHSIRAHSIKSHSLKSYSHMSHSLKLHSIKSLSIKIAHRPLSLLNYNPILLVAVMLGQRVDGGPALQQHLFNVSFLPGW